MANCEKIVLCGFAGAGKSSLLERIEKNSPSGWSFQDLDRFLLEASREESISELVGKIGWQKFREKEFETLMDWMSGPEQSVLALGGGALTDESLALLQQQNKIRIIYLHADFETCWKRLNSPGTEERPLILKGKEHLKELYQKRAPVFKKVPHRLENKEGQNLEALSREFWELAFR
jgi:shikimate kinase